MTEMSCKEIEQMLVDYTDRQLSPAESSDVAEHLARCRSSRKMLQSLQKSLELAEVVWQDGLADIESIRVGIPAKRRLGWPRYAAVAASILVMLGVCLVLWRQQVKPSRVVEPSFAEVERRINEAGSAARLLAAAELLTGYPEARTIVEQQYRYIIEKYPGTPAAAMAKLRVE